MQFVASMRRMWLPKIEPWTPVSIQIPYCEKFDHTVVSEKKMLSMRISSWYGKLVYRQNYIFSIAGIWPEFLGESHPQAMTTSGHQSLALAQLNFILTTVFVKCLLIVTDKIW